MCSVFRVKMASEYSVFQLLTSVIDQSVYYHTTSRKTKESGSITNTNQLWDSPNLLPVI
jgi:hypothetical protein